MAKHISATHRIAVELPIDQCQALFTPAGEELWVDGWTPKYLHPDSGHTVPGMVFSTGEDEELTIWMLIDYTQHPHCARYVRTTPASRTGTVDVTCKMISDASTEVTVTYTMTALSESGEMILDEFVGESYCEMIQAWKMKIDARLPELRKAIVL